MLKKGFLIAVGLRFIFTMGFRRKKRVLQSRGVMTMTIISVDPRPDKLEHLTSCIAANHPEAKICSFTDPLLAYKFGAGTPVDSVYTYIDMKRLTGFELSKMLRRLYPQILTNFICQSDCFRRDAMNLAAHTYLVEPLTAEKMRAAEVEAAKENEEFENV